MQQLDTAIRAGDVADEIPEIDLLHGRRQGVEAGSLASRCITADGVNLAAVFAAYSYQASKAASSPSAPYKMSQVPRIS